MIRLKNRREIDGIRADRPGMSVMVSTAYMDEAERCSRVGLMYKGAIIREGSPAELRRLVRGDLLAIITAELTASQTALQGLEGVLEVQVYGDRLHLFVDDGVTRQPEIERALTNAGIEIREIRPTVPHLEEAFISLVTHQD